MKKINMLTARYVQENGSKWIAECTTVQAREAATVKDGVDSFYATRLHLLLYPGSIFT